MSPLLQLCYLCMALDAFAEREVRDRFSALKDMHGNEKHHLHPDAVSHHLGDELTSRNITDVYCVGTAGDYCVSHTAMDVADAGFKTYVIEDVTKSFYHGEAWPAMKKKLAAKKVEVVMKDGPEVGRVRAISGKGPEKRGSQPTMVFNGNFTAPVFFGYSAEQAKGLL